MLFPLVELALFVITLTNSVYAHQPSDWLAAVETFSADFLYPGNGVIAASGKYPIFQSDVKGRVDVTTAFIGDELNVEYIFGLFAQVNETNAHLQDTFLLPVPISGKLQSLAIQDNIVSLSNIVDFTYFKQNITLPIQLDAWFAFDRKTNQMQQYDVTFRRFAWFWKDVIPKLMPDLEKENHVRAGSMGQQELITLHAARHICSEHDKYCTDHANRQYDSTNDCLNFLVYNRTFGEPFELGQDTTGCRYMHTAMLKYRPYEHCPHVGVSGGKMCVGRNYSQNVNQDMYEHTWIAPTSNSPESMEGISDHSMLELVNANMVVPHPFTMGWFPSVAMLYTLLLWFSAIVSRLFLHRSRVFRQLSWVHQRTSVVYVLSIVYTTAALALQAVSMPLVWYEYSEQSLSCARLAAVVICGLYIFELTYRDTLRIPLLIHHLVTIFAIVWIIYCMDALKHPSLITTGQVWLLQATLEQVVFLGLLSYRLEWSPGLTRFCLTTGATISMALKLAAAVWLLVIWGTKQLHYSQPVDKAFSVILWIAVPCLLFAQVWGTWACYSIAKSLARRQQNATAAARPEIRITTILNNPSGDSLYEMTTPSTAKNWSPYTPTTPGTAKTWSPYTPTTPGTSRSHALSLPSPISPAQTIHLSSRGRA